MHFFQEIIEGGGAPPLAPKSSVTVVSTSSTTVPSGLVRYPTLLGRERPATQAKTVQWTVFSESPSSYAAKACP